MKLSESYKKRLQKLSGVVNESTQPGFDKLKTILLGLGGKIVIERFEEDLYKLLTRGQAFNSKSKIVKMRDSRCHTNSACFWGNYSDEHGPDSVKIVTGWALTKDDMMWRQHTWVYLPAQDLIVETTVKRQKYFGFILDDNEANEFYNSNY